MKDVLNRSFGRFLAILALCISGVAFGGPLDPSDVRVTQNNANNPSNGIVTRYLSFTNGDCLMWLNNTTQLPDCMKLGSGISLSSGTMSLNQANADWSASSGSAQILNKPALFSGNYNDLSNLPSLFSGDYNALTNRPSLFSGDYNSLFNKPTIPAAQVNTDWNASSGVSQLLNKPTLATVATSGSYTDLTNKPTRSFSYTTRSLNTCFQLSSTRDAFVTYAVDIGTTLSLSGGSAGTVYLRTYTNSSCSTGAQELARFVNGNTGTLTVGLSISQNVTGTLTGMVPSGAWVQLVTENTTGTPTFTARPGQEVLLP